MVNFFFELHHDMLYPNLCYNEVCYKGTALKLPFGNKIRLDVSCELCQALCLKSVAFYSAFLDLRKPGYLRSRKAE